MKNNVILISNISLSYFSVARHYGGATIEGKTYRYFQERDILVREDWVKCYQRLPWEDFVEAVKAGVKPQLPTKRQPEQPKRGNVTELPLLFD